MELSNMARLVQGVGMVSGSCGFSAARAAGSASEVLGSVTAPMAYASTAAAGTAEFSVLLWAPLLLVTFGCVAWLLWLIVSDARKQRMAHGASDARTIDAVTTAIEQARAAETTIQAGRASDELEELVATRMELQKLRERLLCDFGGAPVSGG